MPHQRAGYDSPTQAGESDGDDGWFGYDAQQEETDSETEGELMGNSLSRPYTPNDPRLYSPSRPRSGRSSSLSFSVLDPANYDDEFPPLGDAPFSPITTTDSPPPLGDALFSPDTPSNNLPQPWRDLSPLPPLSEWFNQPLFSILNLPPDDIPAPPPTEQSLATTAPGQQPTTVNDAQASDMQQSVHELALSEFFDAQSVREIMEALEQQQQSDEPQSEENETQSESEERYILPEEYIDMSAIRERSVMDIRFATEMPTPEPEEQPAGAPQPGYIPPPIFQPPYTHFMHMPTVNDGRLPHQHKALEYLCAALFIEEDRLKWSLLHRPIECFNQIIGMTTFCHITKRFTTIAHMTALTPEAHVSVTGNNYGNYLRENFNFAVAHRDLPMVELSDGFLAPLESLTIYYHI